MNSEPVPDDSEVAPIVAVVDLGDGVTVEFAAVESDAIGIGFGGPVGSEKVESVPSIIAAANSPLQLFELLTNGQDEAPAELIALSDAVVESGNWSSGSVATSDAQQPSGKLSFADADVALEPGAAPPPGSLSQAPRSTAATCNNLDSSGSPLAGDYGNCSLYYRDKDEYTEWRLNDLISYAGHVIADTGSLWWTVRKKNCTGCSYHEIFHKLLFPGQHWYWYYTNTGNDFKVKSKVEANGDGNRHYHDVARVHDYFIRVIHFSAADTRHRITYSGAGTLFCTEGHYVGPDPSNISTGSQWEGSNGLDC